MRIALLLVFPLLLGAAEFPADSKNGFLVIPAAAQPGDTVYLPDSQTPLPFSVDIRNRAGLPGKPIVIDGRGATLCGSDPLRPEEWREVSPGLFASTGLYTRINAKSFMPDRFFVLFNGRQQRMGRPSKGKKEPFRNPETLKPEEWTFVPESKTFYICLPAGVKPAEAKVEIPCRSNGVGVYGNGTSNIVIRNIHTRHFINDGFNIHNNVKAVRFENISSFENGDDGFSAHEASETEVENFRSVGNTTGICNINEAVCRMRNVFIADNAGFDFFALNATQWDIDGITVHSSCAQSPVSMSGTPQKNEYCRAHLRNAVFIYTGTEKKTVEISRNAALTVENIASTNLIWRVRGEATVSGNRISGEIQKLPGCAWKE